MNLIQSVFLTLVMAPLLALLLWPIAGVDRPDRNQPWRRKP